MRAIRDRWWRAPVLLMLAGCGALPELPPQPNAWAAPRLEEVVPGVAVASLGSPLMLRGSGLAAVQEVQLGPLRVPRAALAATDTQIVLHVTAALLGASWSASLDGQPLAVRALALAGEATAPQPVRVFSGATTITDLGPLSTAPGQLLFLQGRGFDGEVLENNDVRLVRGGWAGPDAQCAEWSDSVTDAEAACARARVLWAARGLVIAVLSRATPFGPASVRYRNLVFRQIEQAADRWREDGRSAASFYADAPSGGVPETASSEDLAELAGEPTLESGVTSTATVWRDPGMLTVSWAGPQTLRVQGEQRFCEPQAGGGVHPDLRVLLDGARQPGAGLHCSAERDAVVVPVAADVVATDVRHSVQVANPFFQSPVAWSTARP